MAWSSVAVGSRGRESARSSPRAAKFEPGAGRARRGVRRGPRGGRGRGSGAGRARKSTSASACGLVVALLEHVLHDQPGAVLRRPGAASVGAVGLDERGSRRSGLAGAFRAGIRSRARPRLELRTKWSPTCAADGLKLCREWTGSLGVGRGLRACRNREVAIVTPSTVSEPSISGGALVCAAPEVGQADERLEGDLEPAGEVVVVGLQVDDQGEGGQLDVGDRVERRVVLAGDDQPPVGRRAPRGRPVPKSRPPKNWPAKVSSWARPWTTSGGNRSARTSQRPTGRARGRGWRSSPGGDRRPGAPCPFGGQEALEGVRSSRPAGVGQRQLGAQTLARSRSGRPRPRGPCGPPRPSRRTGGSPAG